MPRAQMRTGGGQFLVFDLRSGVQATKGGTPSAWPRVLVSFLSAPRFDTSIAKLFRCEAFKKLSKAFQCLTDPEKKTLVSHRSEVEVGGGPRGTRAAP